MAQKTGNAKTQVLADVLNEANSQLLNNNKSPSRKTGELDNRGSHFYLAMYWAQALAAQTDDAEMKAIFESVAQQMMDNENAIVDDLLSVQGVAVELAGYYRPNTERASKAMRPSVQLNTLIDNI